MFASTKLPVPYVAFGLSRCEAALPEQRGLLVADQRARGRAPPARPRRRTRRRHEPRQQRTVDREELGNSSSQPAARSRSIVRDALVMSVRARAGGQLPGVPRVDRPEGELGGRPCGVRENPLELRRGEVRIGTSPVRDRIRSLGSSRSARPSACPARRSHCARGARCDLSQTTVVSRWFVIPIARRVTLGDAGVASASSAAVRTDAQISSGSCSTHPGRGKCC